MKQQSNTKRLIVSTAHSPLYVVYNIRRVSPLQKEVLSKIERFTFIIIPYIEVYNKFIKYYYINGKVVRADLVLLYKR